MKFLFVFLIFGINLLALDLFLGFGKSKSYFEENNLRTYENNSLYIVNLELTKKLLVSEIGFGVACELSDEKENKEFLAMPVYTLLKFNLMPNKLRPYVVGKYGKVLYDKKEKNDYYSVGLGLTLWNKLQIEGAYGIESIKNSENSYGKGSVFFRYNLF